MKVYVDKKPKSCWNCPCFNVNAENPCQLDVNDKGYFLDEIDGGECPLLSVNELRNSICKKIRKESHDIAVLPNGEIVKYTIMAYRLSQIERGDL